MAVKYFQVKEELLNPKRLDELKEVIASRNMRVTDELSFMNAVCVLDYERKRLDGKEYKKAKKSLMEQIKQCLEYIPVEEQIDAQFASILLVDDGQRLLAFIYNTLMGNFTMPYNVREITHRFHHIRIKVSDEELMRATGITDKDRIKRSLCGMMDVFNIKYDYGDGHHVGMNLIVALQHTTDEGDLSVYEIGLDRAMMHLLPRYIKKLVNEEYIKPLPLVELLDHFGDDSSEERNEKLQQLIRHTERIIPTNPINTDELYEDVNFELAYWYFTDELAKPLDINGDGFVSELEFKEGCGLHPFTIAPDSTKITYRSNGACKGWETMTTATIVLKKGQMLDKPLMKTGNHRRVAFILPYKKNHMQCYINTWDGMHMQDVYISNMQVSSKYSATSFVRRIQNVSAEGLDDMIIW